MTRIRGRVRALNVNKNGVSLLVKTYTILFTFSARALPAARHPTILAENRPMVAGYHLIWTVYGYWLPNDPRGSTSREIRVELLQQGCATVVRQAA
jgi:hypothetical protein